MYSKEDRQNKKIFEKRGNNIREIVVYRCRVPIAHGERLSVIEKKRENFQGSAQHSAATTSQEGKHFHTSVTN